MLPKLPKVLMLRPINNMRFAPNFEHVFTCHIDYTNRSIIQVRHAKRSRVYVKQSYQRLGSIWIFH